MLQKFEIQFQINAVWKFCSLNDPEEIPETSVSRKILSQSFQHWK